MIQAWASAIRLTGAASGLIANIPIATTQNGTTWATIVSVHSRARVRRVPAVSRRRQGTAASSGSAASDISRRRSAGA